MTEREKADAIVAALIRRGVGDARVIEIDGVVRIVAGGKGFQIYPWSTVEGATAQIKAKAQEEHIIKGED